MILRLDTGRKVSEIQRDFSSQFPFLRLEFYYPKSGGLIPVSEIGRPTNGLKTEGSKPVLLNNIIELREGMTVKDLVGIIKDELGMVAHVSRQSGKLWLQITKTEHWTLHQQNDHGSEITAGA